MYIFLAYRQHFEQYLEEILSRVSDLLVLDSPDNGVKHYLSGDDKLFMYDTAGTLVVQSQFPPEVSMKMLTIYALDYLRLNPRLKSTQSDIWFTSRLNVRLLLSVHYD